MDIEEEKEVKKASVIRDKNGRVMKGSIMNPHGNTKVDIWNDLKRRVGNDLEFLYSEAIRLIKFSDQDKIKSSMILGLLNLIKPKVEVSNEEFSSLSHATMHHLYETIIRQEEELRALKGKGSSFSRHTESQENMLITKNND